MLTLGSIFHSYQNYLVQRWFIQRIINIDLATYNGTPKHKLSQMAPIQYMPRINIYLLQLFSLCFFSKFFLSNIPVLRQKYHTKDQTTYRYILDGPRGQLLHQTICTKVLRKYTNYIQDYGTLAHRILPLAFIRNHCHQAQIH
jgi:hypothetical protein